MDSITFNRLKPYVQLEENVSKKPKIKSEKHILKIDLNDAKAVDLLPLPSIGERLVERIIKYRNALGGFINTAQLTEVYGITDSIYQIIRPYVYIEKEHSKIDINNTELEQLKSHPYIGYKKAKLLCIYKEQHQVIRNTEELYTIKALDSNWIHRLEPYIKYR
jgi:competence protein ComEA